MKIAYMALGIMYKTILFSAIVIIGIAFLIGDTAINVFNTAIRGAKIIIGG